MLEYLKGFHLLCDRNIYDQSVLHILASLGHYKALDYVLSLQETKPNINAKDCQGRSAIFCAAFEGHVRCFSILLEHGANYKGVNKHGKSILDVIEEELKTGVRGINKKDCESIKNKIIHSKNNHPNSKEDHSKKSTTTFKKVGAEKGIPDDAEIVSMSIDSIPELSKGEMFYVAKHIVNLSDAELASVLAFIKEVMPDIFVKEKSPSLYLFYRKKMEMNSS